jgi:hypothetical protein
MSTEQMVKKGYNDYVADCKEKGNNVMTFEEYLGVILTGFKTSIMGAV